METKARRFEAARRGRTSSQDINDFMDLVVGDIRNMATVITGNETDIASSLKILVAESRASNEEIERLKNRRNLEQEIAARSGEELLYLQDWRRTKDLSYTGFSDSRMMRVDTTYGQTTIPFNNQVDRFFYRDLDTGLITTNAGVEVSVTGSSESGASAVVRGTPANALNGINESYWTREVRYEPKEDVEEVQCQFEVSVPTSAIMNSNMLVIHPYPAGLVDIISIEYRLSSDPAGSWTAFTSSDVYPNMSFPINNAPHLRLVFSPLEITNLRITLGQRAFANRDGWKSFQYGLQEVSLRLIDYDKFAAAADNDDVFDTTTYPNPTDVNGVITKIKAPAGYNFRTLTGFWANPGYAAGLAVGGIGSYGWPVFYRIFTNAALTALAWDSYNDQALQSTAVDVSAASTDTLYLVTSAAYDMSLSVPPILDYFGLKYTVEL